MHGSYLRLQPELGYNLEKIEGLFYGLKPRPNINGRGSDIGSSWQVHAHTECTNIKINWVFFFQLPCGKLYFTSQS